MKTKKIIKLICLGIPAILVLTVVALVLSAVITYNSNYNKYIKEADISERVYPTIDFVQPWMIYGYTEKHYQDYFKKLDEAGYTGIIFQYSTTGSVYSPSLYFEPTAELKAQIPKANSSARSALRALLEAAEKADFDVYVGLSSPDDWWTVSNYSDENFMQTLADNECAIIQSIYDNYNDYESFCGWYLAIETYENPFGWEKHWVPAINQIIEKIDSLEDGRPLMLSPFQHHFLPAGSSRVENFWTDFLQDLNLRSGDIFAPQDSIGKINDGEVSAYDLGRTYSFLKGAKAAVDKKEGLKFWVNCELFATDDLMAQELYTADVERMALQFDNASHFTDTIVTFSFSHYCLPNGTHASDEDVYEEYLELRE